MTTTTSTEDQVYVLSDALPRGLRLNGFTVEQGGISDWLAEQVIAKLNDAGYEITRKA